mmetsp:Transcript_646/g.1493  ORF Transcript_646/g.1493 Transcript_646/m.1493 type:complete len:344 (+) Transcript_646:1-1032(+)
MIRVASCMPVGRQQERTTRRNLKLFDSVHEKQMNVRQILASPPLPDKSCKAKPSNDCSAPPPLAPEPAPLGGGAAVPNAHSGALPPPRPSSPLEGQNAKKKTVSERGAPSSALGGRRGAPPKKRCGPRSDGPAAQRRRVMQQGREEDSVQDRPAVALPHSVDQDTSGGGHAGQTASVKGRAVEHGTAAAAGPVQGGAGSTVQVFIEALHLGKAFSHVWVQGTLTQKWTSAVDGSEWLAVVVGKAPIEMEVWCTPDHVRPAAKVKEAPVNLAVLLPGAWVEHTFHVTVKGVKIVATAVGRVESAHPPLSVAWVSQGDRQFPAQKITSARCPPPPSMRDPPDDFF